MAIDRRTLIKAFASASAFQIVGSTFAHALFSAGPPSSVFILLHGMFFLEFEGSNLYVATPQHSPHKFYVRPHGGQLQSLPQVDIDLTTKLVAGQVNSFPTDIAQFSASSMQRSDYTISKAKTFQIRMKLPLPKLIFAYRTDTTDRLPADLSRNVSKSIISLAGPRLATITCLQYSPGSDGPYVTSYYAEHPTKVGSVAINAALDAARDPGFCGPNFDLKMLPAYVPDAPRDVDNSLPPGVLGDDEATLEEINQTVGLYRPMLLSAQKGEIQNPKKNDSLSNTSHTSAADQVTAVSADIASCPQLGITHP